MKKYYGIALLVTVVASIISVNINLHSNSCLEYVSLANIEALATENSNQPMDCYSDIQNINDGRLRETVTYCGDCESISCTHWSNRSRCMR